MAGRFDDSRYWDGVASRSKGHYLPPPLVDHKNGEYRRLLDRWGIKGCTRALITDLYDSSFGGSGLVGVLASRAGEIIGLDISMQSCKKAKKALVPLGAAVKLVSGDAREIPMADGSVDLVLSPSTFDHFPEIARALAECHRVLRPGGRLVLALNSADNPLYRLGVRLAEGLKRHEYRTDHFYGSGQTLRLLSVAGFRPGRADAIMHVPLGMTTLAEVLFAARLPPLDWASRRLSDAWRLWGRTGRLADRTVAWWVVAEGVKEG